MAPRGSLFRLPSFPASQPRVSRPELLEDRADRFQASRGIVPGAGRVLAAHSGAWRGRSGTREGRSAFLGTVNSRAWVSFSIPCLWS